MTALARLGDECRVLIGTTIKTWRTLLPTLLLLQLLAWFTYQSSMAVAAVISTDHPWIALGVFSVGFVLALIVAVVILRVVGEHLGSSRMVPDADDEEDDEGRVGLTRMLGLTLLPLLAMYAAFGKVGEAVNQLTILSFVYYGSLGDNLLMVLNPDRAGVVTVLAVLIGAYLLRRVLDWLHNASGWRPLGILVTITEAFFVMGLVLAAARWISDLRYWLRHRELIAWWDAAVDGLATSFAVLRIDLPAFLAWLGPLWEDHIFPALVKSVTEPLIWLAVASLVFGSRVVSVADLWRKGQPLSSQVPGARRLTLVRKMAATAEAERERKEGMGRKVGLWLQETLFGDIDDKYLPTLHALRLVLKAGLPFLTAFVLLHNLVSLADGWLSAALIRTIGGQHTVVWTGLLPGIDLVVGLTVETVRLTLLAVAFHRCLQLFREHAHPSDNPIPAPMPRRRFSTVVVATWRKLRGSMALLLAAFGLSTAGWALSTHLLDERLHYHDGVVGETVAIHDIEITVDEVRYGRFVPSMRGAAHTSSRWMAVSVRASTLGEGRTLRGRLDAPGRQYQNFGGSLILQDHKWVEHDLLFEVDPDDIGQLKLVLYPDAETVVRENAARIDLGPEDGDAQRLVDESAWRTIDYRSYPFHGGN